MSQIDFQSYIALLAAEMPRFSVPGIGSFVWHVEKAQVDPKAGIVAPPRPFLKYEPGHRYQGETIAFLQEYFGMAQEEAEAFLREIGRLASAYVRATNEMDLWKLGKIKKVGAVYKVELSEDAPVPFTAELYEVSLRAGAMSAVAPPPASAPAKSKQDKSPKAEEKTMERSRARVVEAIGDDIAPQPTSPSGRRWGLIIIVIGLITAVVAVGVFWVLRGRKPAQPVEVVLSKPKPDKPAQPAEPASQASSPSSAQKSVPSPAPEKPQQTQKQTASAERKPAEAEQKPLPPEKPISQAPPPSPPKPVASGPRYYIIVGSYPSRAEAEAKAREFAGYRVEYLPGKDPGWVRLSIFSSSDKAEVQQKLREVKSQVPDAWVFTAQ